MKRYCLERDGNLWVITDLENNNWSAKFTNQEDAQSKFDSLIKNDSTSDIIVDEIKVLHHNDNITESKLICDDYNDERLKKFNWGAFLMTGPWCFIYKQWIYLIVFLIIAALCSTDNSGISFILNLLLCYMVGKKGYRIAWKTYKSKFETVERMIKAQKEWMYFGLCMSIFYLPVIILRIIKLF